MMKSASVQGYFALLLLATSGFGCGPSDNVIGTKLGSARGGAGSLAEVAGRENGIGGISGGVAGASGVTSTGVNDSAGAAGTIGGGGNGATPTLGGSGSGGNGGSGGGTSGDGGNGGVEGPLLAPTNGWVDGTSNELEIQGALYADADSTSRIGMTSNFQGAQACIAGTAARVDLLSPPCATMMFTPPAKDCYDEFWGASLNLNLNQPLLDAAPLPFDASALQGFAFELSGDIVPAPRDLRFQVHSAKGVFCNALNIKLKVGVNMVFFRDLLTQCWVIQIPDLRPTAESVKSALLSIEWRVLTNTEATVPYDFCVSNIRALPNQ